MKRLIGAMSFLLLIPACDWFGGATKTFVGSGKKTKREVEIKDVEELKVRGAGKIFLKQGAKESLIIEAEENLMNHIAADVDDEELYLGPKKGTLLKSKAGINYYLVVQDLEHIDLAGTLELEVRSLKTKKLDFELSGASKVKARIQTSKLKVEGTGSSKLYIEGSAKEQDLEISGSMHYDAGRLQSEVADIKVAGASRVTVSVSKELNVDASGVSVLTYRGNPKTDIKKSGAASVNKVG